ncbi:helix-turn-helix transcriptional regulator [Rhizobium sp. RAF56]|uniref:helix-turn-helix transcriptional regulator n=1 Tax=Rhizobium sp. RAF56 TaxID=3233062 RepID=UPI003F9E8939
MGDALPEKLLLTVKEVAHMLSVSEKTLEAWRARNKGPPWIRFEGERRGVRYDHEKLKAWVAEQTK